MNISGIRPGMGIPTISQSRAADKAVGSSELLQRPQEEKQQEESSIARYSRERASQTFGAYDYANQYRPDATFEMKGADSDIRSLDLKKAISDMQKDQLLQQYQTFVGEVREHRQVSLRGGEDFSL
ncbi:MAG: hypothetical protein IIU28_07950 [Lachnospiraceae bacterium]|nr:hypothetical protein [Lachnospiraceae bacterium]